MFPALKNKMFNTDAVPSVKAGLACQEKEEEAASKLRIASCQRRITRDCSA